MSEMNSLSFLSDRISTPKETQPQHFEMCILFSLTRLKQGSPTPRPQTGTGSWPVRNQGAQPCGGRASEASSVLTASPHHSHYHLSSASTRSVAASDSHRSVNTTVNCACEGPRWQAPWENLIPDGLRWSWGNDSAGEQLKIQIIISTINVTGLNYPETIPLPLSVKTVFHETGP